MSRRLIRKIDVWVYRAPLDTPVATSFGVMTDRPAVFLRLEDVDGAYGFGEVWCNFPAHGAEHRARLLTEELSEIVFMLDAGDPAGFFTRLCELTHVRSLQTGEHGPYSQAIAGLDMAAWDLCARSAGRTVRMSIDDAAADEVPAYASGIHIHGAEEVIAAARADGHRTFKVKVGFDLEQDTDSLKSVAGKLREGERLLCDANQAWDLDTALRFVGAIGVAPVGWLEEPLPADARQDDWDRLAGASAIPLAAGENIASARGFEGLIACGSVAFIQPDIAKWGGFSGCLAVARAAVQGGRTYCPHYLGGGIGLIASANLLAAVGGEGLLELDINPNPLRDAFLAGTGSGGAEKFPLNADTGLGVTTMPEELAPFEIMHRSVTAR